MKLTKVTITGADHSIEPKELGPLSKKYPFVEWGILFSGARQGFSRYPHYPWVERFTQIYGNPEHVDYFPIHVSLHLCGGWVRELISVGWSFFDYLPNMVKLADRMQLNMTDETFMTLDFADIKKKVAGCFYDEAKSLRVILQTKRAFQRFEWARTINKEGPFKFDMLYDVSGGKGKLPKSWCAPADGVFCGFAGGLGPDTLEEQLPKIAESVGDHKCWIDMESRVRDEDDKFDLAKVEKCLEIASKWVVPEDEQVRT
jgi:hypothetical protein